MGIVPVFVIRFFVLDVTDGFMEERVTMSNSQQFDLISQLCKSRGLDGDDTYAIAKRLLENYRSAMWLQGGLSDTARSIMEGENVQEVKQWYINLKELTKEELREASINSALFHIYRTNWCMQVVEAVLAKVKEFYPYGDIYYEILTKAYLNEEDKKDLTVAEELQLDRSTYYRRKKEAVLLCGILMWEEAREKCFA